MFVLAVALTPRAAPVIATTRIHSLAFAVGLALLLAGVDCFVV